MAEASVCSRTGQVRDAIVAKVPGKTDCAAITDTDLAGITGTMALDGKSIAALKAGDFDGLTGLSELKLLRNSLGSLPAGVFDELGSLSRLNLYGNGLTGLPAGVFDKLTGLTVLNLGGNSLSSLPDGVFDKLTGLKTLGLHENRSLTASSLAGAFDGLTGLTALRLAANNLSGLPAGVFDRLTGLTTLYLGANKLGSLPAGIFDKLAGLTYLDLHRNGLSGLRKGVFDKLTGLETLILQGNSLTGLRKGVFDKLTALRVLLLQNNKLSSLPENVFVKLSSLAMLWLHKNELSTLPSGVFAKLRSLGHLNLSGNGGLGCLPVMPAKLFNLTLDKDKSAYAACGAAVRVEPACVAVAAGATATYAVKLGAAPNRYANGGNVTVKPASSASGTATALPARLTFTTSNWATAQTVTVTGKVAGAATISHTVSGGGYDGAAASSVAVPVGLAAPPAPTMPAAKARYASVRLSGATVAHNCGPSKIVKWQYSYKSKPPGGSYGDYGSWVNVTGTSTTMPDTTVSSLTNGTEYKFKVRAVNAIGDGAESAESDAVTPLAPPAKPTVVYLAEQDGRLQFWWQGQPNLTDIHINYGPNLAYSLKQASVPGNTSTYSEDNGTLVKFRVRFKNTGGYGPWSDELSGTPGPEALAASNVTHNSARLTLSKYEGWGHPDHASREARSDWSYKYTSPAGGQCANVAKTGGTVVDVTGLNPGATYTYKAYSGSGCSASNLLATAAAFTTSATTPPAPAQPPTPPAPTLTWSAVEATTATLTIGNHTGGWHYRYTAPDGGVCSAQVAAGTATVSLTGLSPATRYTFAAYSNSACLAALATAPAFLTKPGKVKGVTLAARPAQLDVSWTALAGEVTGYKVQWKSGDRSYGAARQNDVTSGTESAITGLIDGTAYTVRVAAWNATGDGAWSAEATGTPGGRASPRARLARVNRALASEAARAMLSSSAEAVSERVRRRLVGESGPSPGQALRGLVEARGEGLSDGTLSLREALDGASVSLPLAAAGGRAGDRSPGFWASGDWRRLSGGGDKLGWDGGMAALHLGMDVRMRRALMAGMAVSVSEAAFEYVDRSGDEPVRGDWTARMTGLHPYAARLWDGGSRIWAKAGFSVGEMEIDDGEAGRQSSDSEMSSLAAGGSLRLLAADTDMPSLDLKADGFAARFDAEDNGDLLEAVDAEVSRLRLALAGEAALEAGAGAALTPSAELGLRWDGGDGETGSRCGTHGRRVIRDSGRGACSGRAGADAAGA